MIFEIWMTPAAAGVAVAIHHQRTRAARGNADLLNRELDRYRSIPRHINVEFSLAVKRDETVTRSSGSIVYGPARQGMTYSVKRPFITEE